jgi:NAD(P)-dependent dehydrogenase (short-subunit alcohol dehydrogenase family)
MAKRKLSDSVVVVTGASSGIGRAAALQFADQGATVVLAARREEGLRTVARECEQRGARALVVPTDVTQEQQVDRLAREAIEHFGRIDVWVNNAAVTLFGRFEETPTDAVLRVFETNLFGYLYGARAALPYFREQGSGVLINVESVVADAPQPFTSAYVSSKYGIHGMMECLRMELSLDSDHDIHVCAVKPASIDTPLFQQAANFTGRAVKALNPTYPAEKVASAIVDLAQSPKRETIVGNAGRLMTTQHSLSPRLYEKAAARMIDNDHFQEKPAQPTEGNLFRPMPEFAQVSGGWQSDSGRFGKVARAALAVAVPVAAVWAVKKVRDE